MDAEKVVEMLVDGDLGDHIREKYVQAMLDELADPSYDDEREWADGVTEWLRDNWL